MRNLLTIHRKQNTLRGKLFGYMLVLAILLVLCVFTAMFFLGQLTDVKEYYRETLDMQIAVLDKEISDYYENAVISTVQLSQYSGNEIDTLLEEKNLTFADLKDNREQLAALQDSIFEPLRNCLLQANASGAFVVWDTTVNSAGSNAQENRSGLYLQLETRSAEKSSVIVYRGDAEVGKAHGATLHGKWRLEYEVSDIPNYADLLKSAALPLGTAHRISPVFELPGTAEKVILVTVPIIGEDGTVYGLCGFELGQMYFKELFSQPSTLQKLTCMFVPSANGHIDSREALRSGVQNGYCFIPSEPLAAKDFGGGLTRFTGENNEYIGETKEVELAPNADASLLVVMFPKEDYDAATFNNRLEILLTMLLLVLFAVAACLLLSKRFITPITRSLQSLHDSIEQLDGESVQTGQTGFREIDELVDFVLEKMQDVTALPPYMENVFQRFIEKANTLTPTEASVLVLLIEGWSLSELSDLLFISESTAKHHIQKIYRKLGVSSRSELMLYIELLRGCGMLDELQNLPE